MNLRPLPPEGSALPGCATHRARRIPKPPIPSKIGVVSINTRPLSDALAQQAESRHHCHQQKDQKEWLEGFALNRVHPALQKGVDLGLIGVRELLCVISISGWVSFWHDCFFRWFRRALYRLRIARPSAVCQWPLRITFWRRRRSSISWCAAH